MPPVSNLSSFGRVDPAIDGRGSSNLGEPDVEVCGIVLAGSQNWGDGRFEQVLRGPMLPLAQTPLICYSLDWLRLGGVRHAVLCTNRSTGAVRQFLGDGTGIGIGVDYYEDVTPRGPAGCARDAARLSGASVFVVVEGSMIPSLDLSALLQAHILSRAAATVVVETERRARVNPKDDPRQAGGVYVFDRRVFDEVAAGGYQDIKQGLLEKLYCSDEIVLTYEVQGIAPRVLDSATYAAVDRWLITEEIRRPRFLADYLPVKEGLHHPTAVVHPSARLIGPVLLGPHVVVDQDAVLVGPLSIGGGSVVGEGAVVSRSCIWDQCVIGAGAHVDASLLSDHATVMPSGRLMSATHLPLSTIRPSMPTRAARASNRHAPPQRSARPVGTAGSRQGPSRYAHDPVGSRMQFVSGEHGRS